MVQHVPKESTQGSSPSVGVSFFQCTEEAAIGWLVEGFGGFCPCAGVSAWIHWLCFEGNSNKIKYSDLLTDSGEFCR